MADADRDTYEVAMMMRFYHQSEKDIAGMPRERLDAYLEHIERIRAAEVLDLMKLFTPEGKAEMLDILFPEVGRNGLSLSQRCRWNKLKESITHGDR